MKSGILLLTFCSVFAHNDERPSSSIYRSRVKRDAVGALHIVTNHAQPIHADVKPENVDNAEKVLTEKPCPKGSKPSHIEPGVGFKVTPAEESVTTYEIKSLRKSLPYTPPTALELVRSISRVVTVIVLFISAVVQFYPTFYQLIRSIYYFMNAT